MSEISLNKNKNIKISFKEKYGETAFNLFERFKDRLKNIDISADYSYHLKHTTPKEMELILNKIKNYTTPSYNKRMEIAKTEGKYKYLGEGDGFKVYEIQDYKGAYYLGSNTEICICGRGNTEEKGASFKRAKRNYNNYTSFTTFYAFIKNEKEKYFIGLSKDTTRFLYFVDINDNPLKYGDRPILPLNLLPPFKNLDKDGLLIKDNCLIKAFNLKENPNLIIPNYVKKICDQCFIYYENLETLTANGVEVIERNAFTGCDKLEKITLNNVKRIERGCFCNCKALTSITCDNVIELGEYAFLGCESLISIRIDKVKELKKGTFRDNVSLERVYCKSLVSYEDSAFRNCLNLNEIISNNPIKPPQDLYRDYIFIE